MSAVSQTAETKHTPLPWQAREHGTFVYNVHGNVCACGDPHASGYVSYTEPEIGSQYLSEAVANAALIVRAVNCHADLLAAARGLANAAASLSFREAEIRETVGNTNWAVLLYWIAQARAAIAKAEAQP